MKDLTKENQYALKIMEALAELFNEESDLYIAEDVLKGDNLTHFIHAMANVAPTQFYNKITGDQKSILAFNHTANQLCFQYSKKIDRTEEE